MPSRAASTAWRITRTLPGRLERVVGAETAGLPTDPLDRVVAGDQRVGGAVMPRLREPLLREVDATIRSAPAAGSR